MMRSPPGWRTVHSQRDRSPGGDRLIKLLIKRRLGLGGVGVSVSQGTTLAANSRASCGRRLASRIASMFLSKVSDSNRVSPVRVKYMTQASAKMSVKVPVPVESGKH